MGWKQEDMYGDDSDSPGIFCKVCRNNIQRADWSTHSSYCQVKCQICGRTMRHDKLADHALACEETKIDSLTQQLSDFANNILREEETNARKRLMDEEGVAWVRNIPDADAWKEVASKASWGSTESVKLLFLPGGMSPQGQQKRVPEDTLAVFKRWDLDGDGLISLDEFTATLCDIGADPDFVTTVFRLADLDRDGFINYEEFLAWLCEPTAKELVSQAEYDREAVKVMFVSGTEWHYLLMQEYRAAFWPLVKNQLKDFGETTWPLDAYAFNKSFYSGAPHSVLLAGVTYYQQQNRWCLELNPADLDGADVDSSQHLLRSALQAVSKCGFFGDKLSFHPTSPAQAALVPADLPQATTDELFSGVTYQPLTLGTACGVLRLVRSEEEELTPLDVAIFEKAPNDIGPVAALLTSELQTPLAHTALLCGNRGTPNAGIPGIWSDPKVLALVGKSVKLVIEANQYDLTETPLEDVMPQAKDPITLPDADLSITSLVPASSECNCIGAKARQYGELEVLARKPTKKLVFHQVLSSGSLKDPSMELPIMTTTLESFVVPFGCAAAHLNSAVPGISPEQLRSHDKGQLLDAILATTVDPALVESVMQKVKLWPTTSGKVIFRSSTNCEDLPGFNGAGLYKSVPAGVSPEEVADALRKVWASAWTERARAERKLFGIDDAQVAVAVLVQPFVDRALVNGVALTANPKALRQVDGVYLNSFSGAGKRVTDGAGSEEIFVHFERAFGEADVEVLASTGTPVLSAAAARGVAAACFWVHQQSQKKLAEQGACLDMEWLLVDAGQSPRPARRWFYLGGYFPDGSGGQTTDPQYPLVFPNTSWFEYDEQVSRSLSIAYDGMSDAAHERLIDTEAMGGDYEVWKGSEVVVCNPRAAKHLVGKPSVAGFPASFWKDVENSKALLPPSIAQWVDQGVAKIVGGLYQIHAQSVKLIPRLESYLQDGYNMEKKPQDIRKRIVLMAEFPIGWSPPHHSPSQEVVLLQSRPFKLPQQRFVREQGQGPPQWVGPSRPRAPTVFSLGWAWESHEARSSPIFSGLADMRYGQRLNRWWQASEGAWKVVLSIQNTRGSIASIGVATKDWKNTWFRGEDVKGFYGISVDTFNWGRRPATVIVDLVNCVVLVEHSYSSFKASARIPDQPVALCVFSDAVRVALRHLEPCASDLSDIAATLEPV